MCFKVIFSSVFMSIAIIYTFFKNIKIDSTTIILILLIFFPWMIKEIKSLELNGIGKIELLTKEEKSKLDQSINKLENINSNSKDIKDKYLNFEDPKLGLAALRIDIEEKLQRIAEINQLNIGIYGIRKLAEKLSENKLIDNYEYMIIRDIVGILNKAVHSKLDEYDVKSYNSIIEIGSKLMGSLNKKIENRK